MTIEPRTAVVDLWCDRCRELGILTPTIMEGSKYLIFSHKDLSTLACLDCYHRLYEECSDGSWLTILPKE